MCQEGGERMTTGESQEGRGRTGKMHYIMSEIVKEQIKSVF